MYWDVKVVRPLAEYRLYVELVDGRRGIFDVNPYLEHGVFRELQDPDYFARVGIVLGALTWPNHQDIAPETLLEEMVLVDDSVSEEVQKGRGVAVPATKETTCP
jgi:hypothetical protein